jgi:uncharacterized circularly permuted ATP-grasp superfamily protein/uncharacterized alpha-E superfamily protein
MTTTAPPGLLDRYRALPGSYDELRAPDGSVRPHWSHLAGALSEMGTVELDHRRRETERLLRNDGVTYNVYGEPQGVNAPWVLDPVPLLVSSDEWATIERGIIQRAELLNLILADLYGPRELIRKGLLPLDLVYGHRGFLRQTDQIRLPGANQLVVYGADLARGERGEPWVLADFAQAPSGAGYALENRVVVSRVLPSLYRDAQVHRLAPFFRALRSALASMAPPGVDDPRVVVLTPGPLNETYFEHAYLARYLGYSLVEGPDLTMQNGRVWLRALGGLEPVDVVLRRVDGWYCDPLELRADSRLGVPGLVEAARRGTVSVVNPLGSNVIENPGLMPFLPKLAEVLLGQDLRLPSATTWWCGDDRQRAEVLRRLDELVIKPIARKSGSNAVYGWTLGPDERDALRRRIEARPAQFVAQERVAFSSVPALDRDGLSARHAMVRSFAVARDGSYLAMPGGLARVAPADGGQILSAQYGGISKDTWVLASEPEKQTGFWLHSGPSVAAIDPAGSMPSRAAENLFWLGRYAERAEGTLRLVRAILDRDNDFQLGSNAAGTECLHVLLGALTHLTTSYPGFVGPGAGERLRSPENELLAVINDPARGGSLASSVHKMLTAANAVRDQLSNDTWLVIGNLGDDLTGLERSDNDIQSALQPALSAALKSLLALAGLATENMVRDPGWRFRDAGRRIERGIQLAALLDATVTTVHSTAADSLMLESVLISLESIITYRRRYRSQAQIETVLDLVLLDATNPRSLAYQLERLSEDIAALPRPVTPRLSTEERLVLETSTRLRLADTAELAGAVIPGAATVEAGSAAAASSPVDQPGDRRAALSLFLAEIKGRLEETAVAIDANHFTHLAPQRVFVAGQSDEYALEDTL